MFFKHKIPFLFCFTRVLNPSLNQLHYTCWDITIWYHHFTMLPLKYTFKALWLLDVFPKVLFTLLNCCWSLMICFYVSALRDNRIELVRASWKELTISINDVTLSDEGQYTCSLFTMPVKTSKAFLTVLGKTSRRSVPSHPHQSVLLRSTHSSLIWGQWALSRHMILFLHFGGTGSDVNERTITLADGDIRCVTVCFGLWSACARIWSSHSEHCMFIYHFYLLYTVFHNTYCLQVHVQTIIVFVFLHNTYFIIYTCLYRQLLLLLLFCVVVSKSGGITFTLFLYSTLHIIVLSCICFFVCFLIIQQWWDNIYIYFYAQFLIKYILFTSNFTDDSFVVVFVLYFIIRHLFCFDCFIYLFVCKQVPFINNNSLFSFFFLSFN